MHKLNPDKWCALAVAVCAAVCYLPRLGAVVLLDRDEPRFAQATREMVQRADWRVPYFNGEPRLHKPPLTYWVMAGAYAVLGVSEFAARAGSALAGIGVCVLVYVLGRRMFSRQVGLLAGLIAATYLHGAIISRAATADSIQMLTLMLCFLGFWLAYQGDRRWWVYVLLYGGVALGGLAKGPVVPAVFTGAALGTVLMTRRVALIRQLGLIPGLLAAAAVVAVWLIPADQATGGEFIRVGLGHHVLNRAFGHSLEGHHGPFVYYLATLPLSFFPWIACLPLSLKWLVRDPDARAARDFLIPWAVVPFLLFSFLKTKLPHYTMPAFPALAIVCAYGLDVAIRQARSIWDDWLGRAGMIIFAAVGVGLAVGAVVFTYHTQLVGVELLYPGIVLVLVLMVVLVPLDMRRCRNRMVVVDLAVGSVLLILCVSIGVLPAIDQVSGPRLLARELADTLRRDDELLSLGYREPSLVFYAGRRVRFVHHWDQVTERLDQTDRLVCVVRDKFLPLMPPRLQSRLHACAKVRGFLPSKSRWMAWTIFRSVGPDSVGPSPRGGTSQPCATRPAHSAE